MIGIYNIQGTLKQELWKQPEHRRTPKQVFHLKIEVNPCIVDRVDPLISKQPFREIVINAEDQGTFFFYQAFEQIPDCEYSFVYDWTIIEVEEGITDLSTVTIPEGGLYDQPEPPIGSVNQQVGFV